MFLTTSHVLFSPQCQFLTSCGCNILLCQVFVNQNLQCHWNAYRKLKLCVLFPFLGIWDISVQSVPKANKLEFSGLFLEDKNSGVVVFILTNGTYSWKSLPFQLGDKIYISEPVIFSNIMSWWENGFYKSLDYICWFITHQVRNSGLLTGIYFKISIVKDF